MPSNGNAMKLFAMPVVALPMPGELPGSPLGEKAALGGDPVGALNPASDLAINTAGKPDGTTLTALDKLRGPPFR